MIKKISLYIITALLLISHGSFALAQNQPATVQGALEEEALPILQAVEAYAQELEILNEKLPPEEKLSQEQITALASQEVNKLIDSMNDAQEEVYHSFDSLKTRVQKLPKNDPRRSAVAGVIGDVGSLKEEFKEIGQDIKDAFSKEDRDKTDVQIIDDFLAMDVKDHLTVLPSLGGTLPVAEPSQTFRLAYEDAMDLLSQANRMMIAPAKPDNVPEGDLVEDFIPNLVRQLFRFAWLASFVGLVVAGVMFVMAFGNDERLDKAKRIIYYSIIGFGIITLAFAIVNAVTDIDFFRFI